MRTVLATLITDCHTKAKRNCFNVESLVDDDGSLIIVSDMSYPVEELCENAVSKEEALNWIHACEEKENAEWSESFAAENELFKIFPFLAKTLDVKLAEMIYDNGPVCVMQVLCREDNELSVFLVTNKTSKRIPMSNEDALDWLKTNSETAKQSNDTHFSLTTAGAICYPDIEATISDQEGKDE